MKRCLTVLAISLALLASGCSEQSAPPEPQAQPATEGPAGFVNTVWSVSESSGVAPGTLYVFLSDGSLVITSSNSKPALGKWRYEGGVLTMIETGLPYQADIVTLTRDEFTIKSHSPGAPVTITFAPAERPSR